MKKLIEEGPHPEQWDAVELAQLDVALALQALSEWASKSERRSLFIGHSYVTYGSAEEPIR